MLLKDKICFVSGAGKGLGRAIVEAFLREGAIVYANDREIGSLEIYADNPNVEIMYFDVSDSYADKEAILRIKKEKGCLDVLVNNAGIMTDALIGTISRALMEEIFATNVFGTMELLQLAAKQMISQHSGSIINLSSIVGITGNPGQLVYSATKGAIIALTKTAAKELGPRGIRVNAIAPGMIDTDMMRSIGDIHLQHHISNIPLGRLGRPTEIAEACVYLASDMSSYVTGHILQVDASVLV
ncbi:SDR family NAD(P)-dependent oxidoreductase [Clostridium sp. AF18-27]|uniref:SDR family NAD(P)-dependent oxidoreductase n=1 Tax=Enterocloster lavalensis TaxID=460384 RepID=UPI000E50B91C|nr:SDR family NAD(P)-dependent oxidoreductase [Enterocloster lavalensis]RHR51860.1 SDR family NAD(P)-dependent oxidoreductase [Clostridium sp. AF18-27]